MVSTFIFKQSFSIPYYMLYVNINFTQYIRYLEHLTTAVSSAGWILG